MAGSSFLCRGVSEFLVRVSLQDSQNGAPIEACFDGEKEEQRNERETTFDAKYKKSSQAI